VIELEVHNFQSVRHATMAVNGFAAIVGRSNIGKSALVRAVHCALTGAVGTNFVRHGTDCDRRVRGTKKCKCSAKVVVRTQKMEVTWEKGDNVNKYTVVRSGQEPEVFEGLDRGTPPFLLPDFELVKVGEHKELIQVPSQFEPIFLLNQSGLAVADVLSDVARLDQINVAMTMANKDRKDAASKRKVREEDVGKLQASLVKYDGLNEVPVQELLDDRKTLLKKRKALEEVTSFIERLSELRDALLALDEALKPELPNHEALELKNEQLDQAAGFFDRLTACAPELRRLMGVDQIEVPKDETEALRRTIATCEKVDVYSSRLTAVSAAIEQYGPVENVVVPDDPQLGDRYDRIVQIDGFFQRFMAVSSAIQEIEGVDVPELDVDPVLTKHRELGKVTSLIDRATLVIEAASRASKELKQAEEDERQVLTEMQALGICPVCDQAIGKEHALHLEGL
jgi:DNA repair ATPase RecN